MRTEEDLRAALASLEDQEPNVKSVLSTISLNGPRRLSRRRLPPRRSAVLAGLGTAVAAGVAVAVAVTQSPSGAGAGRPAPAAQVLPTHQALQAKLLDALSAAANEIVYDHTTITASSLAGSYGTPDPLLPSLAEGTASETWYYPWRATAGQPVRGRELTTNPDGTPSMDVGFSYPEPTESQEVARGQLTTVDYAHRTWSAERSSGIITDGDAGSPLSLWELIHNEPWSIVGRTELDGQPAIKLELKGSGRPAYLWVNAQTYQPLRESYTFGGDAVKEMAPDGKLRDMGSGQASIVTDYQYLAPTPANLAKLTVPIPEGFRRTGPAS